MRPLLLILLLAAPARAVEIPRDWICDDKDVGRHWRGMRLIDEKEGPHWGDKMDAVPTPFIWLVIYQHRDRDVAERRAPINARWKDFLAREKCAYFKHYAAQARERLAEFDALVDWKQNGKLVSHLADIAPDAVVAAQEDETVAAWRERFEKMRLWLEGYGLKEAGSDLEAAQGILVRLGRLKVAHLDFQRASGRFAALVRGRFDAARADAAAFTQELKARGAGDAQLALLNAPGPYRRVVADLSEQLAQDPDNKKILGDDFARRVAVAAADIEREREQQAHAAEVQETREQNAERKRARKRAERAVDRLEQRLKDEKLLFPADADPKLLVSLEEYRRGRVDLYPLAAEEDGEEKLEAAYLKLLRDVCVTHYVSIRYKQKLIDLLCGK